TSFESELLQIKEMADQDTPSPTITAMKIPIIKKGEYDIWTIPDEYLLKFHNVPDARSLWAAIKSRFGGNDESKKMQKNVLKHQFENFVTALNETLDKAYDRFQKLISKLEIHGAYVSKEDINQKFLRSLPPSWNQIVLIMRNKPEIDEIDIDDLYNNLRVYKDEMKRSSTSTSTSQNLTFLSSGNTSSTNKHALSLHNQQPVLNLKMRIFSKLMKITWRNWTLDGRSGRNQGRRPYGDNGRSNAPTNKSSSHALVAQDGLGGYDWSNDFEVEPINYTLMAISSSSSTSSSNNEVQKYSKQCLESFNTLQKNFDSEKEKHNRARFEIQSCELALESLEARIIGHEKNELAWGEKYEFQNYELKCFGTQMDDLSNKSETDSEISLSVFEVRSSNEESTLANNKFTKADGYHVVPPPITRKFLTPRADISFAGLDEYAIRNKIIESKTTKTSETVGNTNEANVVKPKSVNETVVSKPKINRDEVIIEDWNSDDEDDVCAVQTVSSVTPNVTQAVRSQVDKIGQTSQK
ncbi:hypothetical protein Tco_1432264, partial [Tanacetum coccineum]